MTATQVRQCCSLLLGYLVLLQFDNDVDSCCSSVSVVSLRSSCALPSLQNPEASFLTHHRSYRSPSRKLLRFKMHQCVQRHTGKSCLSFACLSCWRPLFDGHVGHSLGAGVASLAAPWAALQWPGADIRCVTFGNPKPGNQAYSDVSHNLFPPVSCHGLTVLTTQAVFCLLASYLH